MANDNGIVVAERKAVPMSDEVRSQTIKDMLLLACDTAGAILRLRYGRKPTKSGGVSITYATVKVPGKPRNEEEALAQLFQAALAKVTLPKDGESDLSLSLAPEMSGERCAVVFAVLSGRNDILDVDQAKFDSVLAAIKATKASK